MEENGLMEHDLSWITLAVLGSGKHKGINIQMANLLRISIIISRKGNLTVECTTINGKGQENREKPKLLSILLPFAMLIPLSYCP